MPAPTFDDLWSWGCATRDRRLVQALLDIGPLEYEFCAEKEVVMAQRIEVNYHRDDPGKVTQFLRMMSRQVTSDEHYELEHRRKVASDMPGVW